MTAEGLRLANPPIVEAIVDIDCDLPPGVDFRVLQERAARPLGGSYPNVRPQHDVEVRSIDPDTFSADRSVIGIMLLAADERQVVQFRREGYSFHRLAPYGTLDDYLPDIERTWRVFRELAQPVQIRTIGLRFINRILLPLVNDGVRLDDYLRLSPRLPDEGTLRFTGFLNQHSAVEITTGHDVNITLAAETAEGDRLPIIFDIATSDVRPREPEAWEDIREALESLRRLKNRVFERTLTERCLNLFQQA